MRAMLSEEAAFLFDLAEGTVSIASTERVPPLAGISLTEWQWADLAYEQGGDQLVRSALIRNNRGDLLETWEAAIIAATLAYERDADRAAAPHPLRGEPWLGK